MPKAMKVEIDSFGHVHPLDTDTSSPDQKVPEGAAILTWPTTADEASLYLSESSLAEDWMRPEEDAAWAHLQPAK